MDRTSITEDMLENDFVLSLVNGTCLDHFGVCLLLVLVRIHLDRLRVLYRVRHWTHILSGEATLRRRDLIVRHSLCVAQDMLYTRKLRLTNHRCMRPDGVLSSTLNLEVDKVLRLLECFPLALLL